MVDLNNDVVENGTVEEKEESVIDLKKFDEADKPKVELSEFEILKAELLKEKQRADQAEEKARKAKEAMDKKATEAAAKTKEARALAEQLEVPNEELERLREELGQRILQEKRTNLLLAATEELMVNQAMASTLVDAAYDPDTNELNVDNLVSSVKKIITDVRKQEYERGYNVRDNEVANGKQRSVGGNEKDLPTNQKVLNEYLNSRKKR